MSGVGPVEPGEDTCASDDALTAPGDRWPPGRLHTFVNRHRRAAVAAAAAITLTAAAAWLYATRPLPPPPPPTPWPAQAVALAYTGPAPPAHGRHRFGFSVTVTTTAGPPVTVERITQPSQALTVASEPAAPFTVSIGKPHTVIVRIRVLDCQKVARNAGLPFLDVTLRNVRAMQQQSFILGERYAADLARAIGTQCPHDPMSVPKVTNSPARSQYVD